MNIYEFKKLQKVQIEIMDEIHRICTENNITYYIIGGTALGARRHSGFIPWDLDIDIAMPREDYENFADICKSALSPRFMYRNYRNTKAYSHPHALLCIKNTFLSNKFSKYNPTEYNIGIYLDIFPLDSAPNDHKQQIKQAKKLQQIKKLKQLKQAYKYDNNRIKNMLKDIISTMIFWTTIDKINAIFDNECKKYNLCDSTYVCSMASHYTYQKQCMPIEIYGTPQLVKFENREYFAPELLDEYLSIIYGDYMSLPPKNEQKANLEVFDEVIFDC